MSHITTEDPATLRLPFKEKLSYGIGDWPLTSCWILVRFIF
ncbi:hypothetical protein ACVXHB_20830 [Escherichia coli]